MLDRNNPEHIKKIMKRAVEVSELMADMRLIIEIARRGGAQETINSILIGGICQMSDEDYDSWISNIKFIVATASAALSKATATMLQNIQKDKDQQQNEASFDVNALLRDKKLM